MVGPYTGATLMASHYLAHKRNSSYISELDSFFDQREAKGLGVPQSSVRLGCVSTTYISGETGIPVRVLDSGRMRSCILRWVERIGLGEPVSLGPPPVESSTQRGQIYVHKMDQYIDGLRREGKRVPENPAHKGKPHLNRISSESGVPLSNIRHASPARRLLLDAIAELGVQLYLDNAAWNLITYEQLSVVGTEWRKEELKGKANAGQQLSNTRSALHQFMDHPQVRRTPDDPVGPELLEDFDQTVRKVAATIVNKHTRRKFSVEIARWQHYYHKEVKSQGLPPDFRTALELSISRAGLTVARLATLAEGSQGAVMPWLRGLRYPSRSSFPLIERIEKVLDLPPKTLISRVARRGSKRFNSVDYPEFVMLDGEPVPLRENHNLLPRLRPLLPDDFNQRPMKDREEMCQWLITNLVGPTSKWGFLNRALASVPYSMNSFPPVVEREWAELASFKGDMLAPPGMKRNDTWSPYSVAAYRKDFGRIFGALALAKDAKDSRLRGLGLEPDAFTLSMFACPKILHWWIRWKGTRRREVHMHEKNLSEEDARERYTQYEAILIFMVGGLFQKDVGWLRQRPDLISHLKPIPGFIDSHFIERAKNDWDAVCDEAFSYYKNLGEGIEQICEQIRDPFEPILPILESDSPIAALRLFAQNILDDAPDPAIAPYRAAVMMRNYLIVRILGATALRSKNIRELTYRDDNSGQLRREGEEWVIEIPFTAFKNRRSSFFGSRKKRENYRKVLADKDGLYERIKEYIKIHRFLLLGGVRSDIFLVSNSNRPLFTTTKFHRNYRVLTMRYLAHNPYLQRGIPGVKPHGPHAVRDIIATHVIKETGSYELAAYAICDSVITVRVHYARFRPQEKCHLVDKIINAAWE